jgi:hypothetical protein
MPEKEARKNESGAKIDFKALEVEVNREIDSLFVPSADRAGVAVRETRKDDFPGIDPSPEKSRPAAAPEARVDFEALQVEIEKEIDSLIVPASRTDWDAGPAPAVAPEKTDNKPRGFDDINRYYLHELSGLIEMFNAAYLSLDWDFSRENIQKFITSLERLEPFAARSHEAKSVQKILDVILRRLLERPHAINSILIQLIRDSQGLLAHILLLEGNTGPHEKLRIKDLKERFQDLRQRAIAARAGAKSQDISQVLKAQVGTPGQKIDEVAGQTPQASEEIESFQPPSTVRRESLCLMVLRGKCLALPSSCILKVAHTAGKKRLKIMQRGYATLADFADPLRGIRRGIMGDWTELPTQELKSYRFEPLLDPLGPDKIVIDAPVAVLASDGLTHRIIFCEIANFIADAETSNETATGKALGPFEHKRRLSVPVFDLPLAEAPAKMSFVRSPARRAAIRFSNSASNGGAHSSGGSLWRPKSWFKN